MAEGKFWPPDLWPSAFEMVWLVDSVLSLANAIRAYEEHIAGEQAKALMLTAKQREEYSKVAGLLRSRLTPFVEYEAIHRHCSLRQLFRASDYLAEQFDGHVMNDFVNQVCAARGWSDYEDLGADVYEIYCLSEAFRRKLRRSLRARYYDGPDGEIVESVGTQWCIKDGTGIELICFHCPLDEIDQIVIWESMFEPEPQSWLFAERIIQRNSIEGKGFSIDLNSFQTEHRVAIARLIDRERLVALKPYSKCRRANLNHDFRWPHLDSFSEHEKFEFTRFGYSGECQGLTLAEKVELLRYSTQLESRCRSLVWSLDRFCCPWGNNELRKWRIPISDFPHKEAPTYPRVVYERDPFEWTVEIEALTETRLKAGENPLWFINEYHRFLESSSAVSFAEYCQHAHSKRVESVATTNGTGKAKTVADPASKPGNNPAELGKDFDRPKVESYIAEFVATNKLDGKSGERSGKKEKVIAELKRIGVPADLINKVDKILKSLRARKLRNNSDTRKRTQSAPKRTP